MFSPCSVNVQQRPTTRISHSMNNFNCTQKQRSLCMQFSLDHWNAAWSVAVQVKNPPCFMHMFCKMHFSLCFFHSTKIPATSIQERSRFFIASDHQTLSWAFENKCLNFLHVKFFGSSFLFQKPLNIWQIGIISFFSNFTKHFKMFAKQAWSWAKWWTTFVQWKSGIINI